MFARARQFLRTHRRKFLISGLLVGGVVVATRYAHRKLREWQEKEIREMLERSRRRQHFESTERTCNQTILSLAANARETVVRTLNSEAVVDELRGGSKDKIALWNTLKVLAFARCAAIIYVDVMLVATLRVQLNLIGGYMFKDSRNAEGAPTNGACMQEYLSLCEYFMTEGIERLCLFLKEKVAEITSSISLRDELTLHDLERIFWTVMSSSTADAAGDPVKNLSRYVLPPEPRDLAANVSPRMIDETLDLLESDEVRDLAQSNVRTGFVLLLDRVAEYFAQPRNGAAGTSDDRPADGFLDLNRATIPMAKIIPIVNGQVPDVPTQGDVSSDWLQQLLLNDKLKTLGANIYEAFSF